jgi:hypothetical protein
MVILALEAVLGDLRGRSFMMVEMAEYVNQIYKMPNFVCTKEHTLVIVV